MIAAETELWSKRFICYHPLIFLTDTVLKDILEGLEFGKLIRLPEELALSSQLMADLLVSEEKVRHFSRLQ